MLQLLPEVSLILEMISQIGESGQKSGASMSHDGLARDSLAIYAIFALGLSNVGHLGAMLDPALAACGGETRFLIESEGEATMESTLLHASRASCMLPEHVQFQWRAR